MTQRTRWLLLSLGAVLALGLLTACNTSWGTMGPSMMGRGGPGWGAGGSGTPLTLDEAIGQAERYVSSLGVPGLQLSEIMEFDNQFYVAVEEADTGMHAFEILVDRYSGAIYPEPGPNMMWNRKYGGMMGRGMRGGGFTIEIGIDIDYAFEPMPIGPEQAREIAQRYLDGTMPGALIGDEADAFYGYYTIHFLRDGRIAGMLSVHGYTGEVWLHAWHGRFLGMRSFGE